MAFGYLFHELRVGSVGLLIDLVQAGTRTSLVSSYLYHVGTEGDSDSDPGGNES